MTERESYIEKRMNELRGAILVSYDWFAWERRAKREAKYILPYIGKNSIVIDYGCGIGRLHPYLAPHCKLILAIDINCEMLYFAQLRNRNLSNVIYMSKLDVVKDNIADFCIGILFFQHLEGDTLDEVMNNIVRVLKPNGRLLACNTISCFDLDMEGIMKSYGFEIEKKWRYPQEVIQKTPKGKVRWVDEYVLGKLKKSGIGV